jgi:putative transposase
MVFELFDPLDDVQIREGCHLPHWYQPGVTYFITFRTEDSIPAGVAKTWHRRRGDWLRRHGVDSARHAWNTALAGLPRAAQREFHATFSREFLEHLDQGHGTCLLRHQEIAQIVADGLRHFDGLRYSLGDFVIMPNHVHVMACLSGETEVEAQCYSWKKFTATRINRHLQRSGRRWQEESFDHLIRSPEQFEAVRRYIADNPVKARLGHSEFLYYRGP